MRYTVSTTLQQGGFGMLKKLVSCCLVLMVVVFSMCPAVLAESSVVLRNGVNFGDTMSQVRAKETFAISSSSADKLHTAAGTLLTKYAVMSGVSISYYFDFYGKLEDILWQLPKSSIDTLNNWAWLYKEFSETYGTPYSDTHRYLYDVIGKAYEAVCDRGYQKSVGYL